jgi:tetratricopeptide (TPR) repeat protein
VSKATIIRKRALDLVRDQDWSNAIKEYKRLVELDQNNPNVHNELADLYLKTNQKADAYDSFVRAVDEYTRVGLHNNAVAVCKKVLRVLPGRVEVFTKLGYIRARQGLGKEAESYYLQFLDKAVAGGFDPADFARLAAPIAEEMKESPAVLQRLAQALIGYRLNEEAGKVLMTLYHLNEKLRDAGGVVATRAMIDRLGFGPQLDALLSTRGHDNGREGAVITESNIWTQAHSPGERIEIESTPRFKSPSTPAAPAPQPAGAASDGPSERDLYLLRLARGSAEPRPAAASAKTEEPAPAAQEVPPAVPAPAAQAAPEAVESSAPSAEIDEPDEGSVATETREVPAAPAAGPKRGGAGGGAEMQISALLDDETGDAGEADFRSHYDLGMAYLEMDLLAEAIREYQMASRSPQYQVKCLEMIGLCFVKQNQPQLAIRQLNKGLTLIGADSEESLGIKYNLALAYEMVGDDDNARRYFEDVYVVDVTFRDVAEKMRKLSPGS